MRCPNCGTINPPEEQLTYCQSCGAELRVVCPRCSADNPAFEEFCRECNLELHPDRGHERSAGIRGRDLVDDEEPWLSRHGQLLIGGLVLAAILWIPVANTLRKRSQFNTCQQHLGKIAIALRLYRRDNDETMPPAENWTPLLLHYLKDSSYLACPSRSAKVGYAFNSYLSGQKVGPQMDGDAITFFEAEGGTPNLAGDDTLWMKDSVHPRGNNVVLYSGAVKVLRAEPGLNNWFMTGTPPVTMPETHAPKDENKTDEPNISSTPGQPPGAPTDAAPGAIATPSGESPAVVGATPTNPPPPLQPGAEPEMPQATTPTPVPSSAP